MLPVKRTSLILFTHFRSSNYSNLCTQILSKPIHKPPNSNKVVLHSNTQITKHGRNGNIKESESVFNRMPHKNPVSYTAILTAYAENGQISKARKVFDEMPDRAIASYNAMITAYVKSNCMVNDAFRLFSQMGVRNEVSYGAMISGLVRAGMFDKAEELYSEMPFEWREPVCANLLINGYLKVGRLDEAVRIFNGMMERDVVSSSSMVDGYCKKGKILEARELFDGILNRNVVTWTTMIGGYMNAGSFGDGFRLFLSMRREGVVAVNPNTLTIMFEACSHRGSCREGMQIHGLVLRMGFGFDIFLGNSMITMYCRFGCMNEANRVFQMMSEKDVVSWNSLISGYVQHDNIEDAYGFFENMPRKDVVSWTTMISGFLSEGDVSKSIQLFKAMPQRDDIAWTAVISGFVSNEEYEEAFHLFIEMLKSAVTPNSHTLSSMVSASAGLATLNLGLRVHAHVVKMDMEFNLSIQNSLVSMYSKCGNVAEAYKIFTDISAPNVVSFNSMIHGFGQNGQGEEALKLFRKMQNESLKPNEITFLGILSACTHIGQIEKGWGYFTSMKSLYNIEPGPDHYACMVDLLGRAGLLDEAIDLIQSMPFSPHSGVWGALLGASRTHFHLDLAKLAAQQLCKLEPDNATPYVVLSDMYNIAGRTKDGCQVRTMKKEKGIKKSPGCSWIVLKDKVYSFLAGDILHIDLEEIKLMLGIIAKEIRGLDCNG